jgi:Sulfotransferase family
VRKVWPFGNRSDARQGRPEGDLFVPGAGPDFICIGAQKAGTTWLYNQLAAHPDFWMPPRKEIHYFNERGHRPVKTWWRTQDERDLRFREKLEWLGTQFWLDLTNYGQLFVAKGSLLSGDITPAYCMLPDEIIAMVIRQFPQAKVIFLARDPVERAWSQISMSVRKGGRAPFDVNDPAEVVHQLLHPLVVLRSHPSVIVARWRRHVAPERFGLFFFDDLKNQPVELRRSIIAFLGGDPDRAHNRLRPKDNRNPGKKPPLSKEVQIHLAKFFARELRACAAELGGPAAEWPARYGL